MILSSEKLQLNYTISNLRKYFIKERIPFYKFTVHKHNEFINIFTFKCFPIDEKIYLMIFNVIYKTWL